MYVFFYFYLFCLFIPSRQYRTGVELPLGTWDFAFVSSRAFILTSTANPGSVEVFSFDGHASNSEPTHIASLRLPGLAVGQEIHNFTTHSAPFIAKAATAGAPFVLNQSDRLHAMTLQYGDRGPRILMLVKNSFFTNLVPAAAASTDAKSQRSLIPWEDWGPQNTRFMECTIRSSWLR